MDREAWVLQSMGLQSQTQLSDWTEIGPFATIVGHMVLGLEHLKNTVRLGWHGSIVISVKSSAAAFRILQLWQVLTKMWSTWNSHYWLECNTFSHSGKWFGSFLAVKSVHPVPVLGIYLREIKICPPMGLYLNIHNSPQLVTVQMSTRRRMDKVWCIPFIHSAIQINKKGLVVDLTSCMNLKTILLGERRQKSTLYDGSFRKQHWQQRRWWVVVKVEWESSWADKVLYCGCGGSITICACQNSSNCTFKLVNSFVNYALQFLNNLS